MRRLEAITVISRAYLPHARVLADSLAAHHRDVRLSVVLVDDPGVPAPPLARQRDELSAQWIER